MGKFALTLTLLITMVARAQTPAPKSIKMPAARAAELRELQAQADKLNAALREIQLKAGALINRAALEAHMTAEQLDAMDLAIDAEGNYEWRPKPPPAPSPTPKK